MGLEQQGTVLCDVNWGLHSLRHFRPKHARLAAAARGGAVVSSCALATHGRDGSAPVPPCSTRGTAVPPAGHFLLLTVTFQQLAGKQKLASNALNLS